MPIAIAPTPCIPPKTYISCAPPSFIAVTTAGLGLPSKGGVVAIILGTPATEAVTTDICADATIGNFPAGT